MTHVGSFYHELSKVSLSTSVCQFCRSDQDCERSLEDMNFGRLRANDGQLEYPQRALFHLCCLRGRLIKHSMKFSPAMLPAISMASRIESAMTMNFEGLRSLCRLKVTM